MIGLFQGETSLSSFPINRGDPVFQVPYCAKKWCLQEDIFPASKLVTGSSLETSCLPLKKESIFIWYKKDSILNKLKCGIGRKENMMNAVF